MNRTSSAIAAVAWAVLSAGCEGTSATASPELPTWVHRPSWSMSVLYRRALDAQSRDETEPYERGKPEIDVAGRRIFIGSSDHGLYAVRAEDGTVLWRFETLGAVQCEPLYDPKEDVVYFGSNDGALYKVHAGDGKLIYRFSTNAEVARKPIIDNGILYAVNANDTVVAINAKTGERVWSQHRTPALGMEIAGYAGPLVHRNLVYVGFSDGTVTAFDAANGAERWQPVDLSAEAEQELGDVPQYLDVDTTPRVGVINETPAIYVGSYEGGVFALDADSGTSLWSNPAVRGVTDLLLWSEPSRSSDAEGPAVPEKTLLLASSGTTGLWALDPETGRDLWQRPLPDGGVSAPEPILGALLVTTTLHGMFLVSPIDGSVIDGIHTGAGFSMTAAAFGRRAFILSNSGSLLSIHITPPHAPPWSPDDSG